MLVSLLLTMLANIRDGLPNIGESHNNVSEKWSTHTYTNSIGFKLNFDIIARKDKFQKKQSWLHNKSAMIPHPLALLSGPK